MASVRTESIATLPPFGPIEGQKWFDRISSQSESQMNRLALIYFAKIQFLPPSIWNLPFMSYRLQTMQKLPTYLLLQTGGEKVCPFSLSVCLFGLFVSCHVSLHFCPNTSVWLPFFSAYCFAWFSNLSWYQTNYMAHYSVSFYIFIILLVI